MLTQHDIDVMRDTVIDLLKSWNMTATIYKPKPEEEQPNWNPIMREYTGDIEYDIIENVPTERLEVTNEYFNNRNLMKAGVKVESSSVYKFPVIHDDKPLVITADMIFTFGDNTTDKYHINTIRNRIGETIVDVDLITGGTDSGF